MYTYVLKADHEVIDKWKMEAHRVSSYFLEFFLYTSEKCSSKYEITTKKNPVISTYFVVDYMLICCIITNFVVLICKYVFITTNFVVNIC